MCESIIFIEKLTLVQMSWQTLVFSIGLRIYHKFLDNIVDFLVNEVAEFLFSKWYPLRFFSYGPSSLKKILFIFIFVSHE